MPIPQHARRIPPGTQEPTVVHRAFAQFWKHRTDLNESIKALDFGHRLALHDLSLKPHLEDRKLSEVYPSYVIPPRFDVHLETSSKYLRASTETLTEAAFLLAQPIYEIYLDVFIEVLAWGLKTGKTNALMLSKRHNWVKERGLAIDQTPQFELFDLLRFSRNAFVHNGGAVTEELAQSKSSLSEEAQALWLRATKETLPSMDVGERLQLGPRAPVGMIYTVGTLGVALNRELLAAKLFNDKTWAEFMVWDYRNDPAAEAKWQMRGYWKERLELVTGYARVFFGFALPQVVESEALEEAVKAAPLPPKALRFN